LPPGCAKDEPETTAEHKAAAAMDGNAVVRIAGAQHRLQGSLAGVDVEGEVGKYKRMRSLIAAWSGLSFKAS
jgi:hypothetical protein